MSKESKQEMKYYTPLIMGFIIMTIGLIAPPLGAIPSSAIYAGGCFLILCAAVVGLDVPAILREIRLLKTNELELLLKEKKSMTKSNLLSNCLKSVKYRMTTNLDEGNFCLKKSAQYEIPGSVIKIISGEKGNFKFSTNL